MKIRTWVKFFKRFIVGAGFFWYYLVVGSATIISCLALYYSDLPGHIINVILALGFLVLCYWAAIRNKGRKWLIGFWWLSLIGVWFIYNATTVPSNDRIWREDMSLPARAIVDNDEVEIINYRKFIYDNDGNVTPNYIDRKVSISDITSMDFYISYWMRGPVGHTFVGFNFKDEPPVVISIEARYEAHESYSPIASLFRQFELIYIVGDEKDVVQSRVQHRQEDVYRYRLNVSADGAQRLFKEYLHRINEIADYPEFYNLIRSNCTINIFRYANRAGRSGSFDIRHLLNGWSDRYLYEEGYIDNDLPFREVRAAAYLVPDAVPVKSFFNESQKRMPKDDQ